MSFAVSTRCTMMCSIAITGSLVLLPRVWPVSWDVPHITMFHTLGRLKQLANPQAPEPPLRLEMEQQLVRHVDRVIVSTVDEQQQLMRQFGATENRVAVIPCGVDLSLFTPLPRVWARKQLNLPVDCPILLFAGRLDSFKGPDLLLRAAAMMERSALVVIVGGNLRDDRDLQQLRLLAEELQIADRVLFLGARPRVEMPLFYSAATITVVPSYHETFGLAAVEVVSVWNASCCDACWWFNDRCSPC